MKNATDQNQAIDQLILVVHGVGDPEPGSTVNGFARAFAAEDRPLQEGQPVWLVEKSNDPNYISTFPCHRCSLATDNHRISLAEVYWGDLTRVCQGWLGAMAGMMQILFGLRYVAYAATDQPSWPAMVLRQLGRVCFRLLHGPVLAVNFCLAFLVGGIAIHHFVLPDDYLDPFSGSVLAIFCSALAFIVACTGWRVTNSRIFERFWFWVKINSAFILTVAVVKTYFALSFQTNEALPGAIWYGRLFVLQLMLLWDTGIFILQLMLIAWLATCFDGRIYRPAIHLGFLLPALAVGLWSHLFLLTWLFVAERAATLMGINAINQMFQGGAALLGVQFLMSLLIAAVAGVSAMQYILWRKRNSVREFQLGKYPPRVIVDGKVQFMLGGCAMIGSSLVLMIGINEVAILEGQQRWLERLMNDCSKYAISALLPTSLLIGFMIPKCRPMFGIALEIVNHFVFRLPSLDSPFSKEDRCDITRTSLQNGNIHFTQREYVIQRMQRVLNHCAQDPNLKQDARLIIISHSQGTMVSLETLNSPEMEWLRDRFSSIVLVTMGSPFHHLYQHYFAHYYPPLESPFWNQLESNVDLWLNIFRIDDPVGTHVKFPAAYLAKPPSSQATDWQSGQSLDLPWQLKTGSENFPVGGRGHLHYWNDQEVLGILRSELFLSWGNLQQEQPAKNRSWRAA